jgi:glycosyltransferase involved in cell wall biosynthesis
VVKVKMILTNGFHPDPRVYKEAKSLVRRGYDVEVLAWDRENTYRDAETAVEDRIKVKRFYPYAKYGSGVKQILPYINFIRQIKQYLKSQHVDIIHAHDIDGMFAATFIKGNYKLIWDMHEFYDGSHGMMSGIFTRLAPRCFKRADGIIIVSGRQRERYDTMIRSETKVTPVMNAAEDEIFGGINHTDSQNLRISFIGGVRDLESLRMMMDIVYKSAGLRFYIHGGGHMLDEVRQYAEGRKNVIITGSYKYEDAAKLYANTDLVYSIYTERVNVLDGMPNKFFESIAAGVPIIINAGSLSGDMVKKLGVGYVVKSGDEASMIDLLEHVKKSPEELAEKRKNISLIRDEYTWQTQEKNLLDLYESLTIDGHQNNI